MIIIFGERSRLAPIRRATGTWKSNDEMAALTPVRNHNYAQARILRIRDSRIDCRSLSHWKDEGGQTISTTIGSRRCARDDQLARSTCKLERGCTPRWLTVAQPARRALHAESLRSNAVPRRSPPSPSCEKSPVGTPQKAHSISLLTCLEPICYSQAVFSRLAGSSMRGPWHRSALRQRMLLLSSAIVSDGPASEGRVFRGHGGCFPRPSIEDEHGSERWQLAPLSDASRSLSAERRQSSARHCSNCVIRPHVFRGMSSPA